MIYEVENLDGARQFLLEARDKITLSNPQGSTRYYGMRIVHHMFKILQQEFPDKIEGIVVNAYDDYSAFITARQLGYHQINYVNQVA